MEELEGMISVLASLPPRLLQDKVWRRCENVGVKTSECRRRHATRLKATNGFMTCGYVKLTEQLQIQKQRWRDVNKACWWKGAHVQQSFGSCNFFVSVSCTIPNSTQTIVILFNCSSGVRGSSSYHHGEYLPDIVWHGQYQPGIMQTATELIQDFPEIIYQRGKW